MKPFVLAPRRPYTCIRNVLVRPRAEFPRWQCVVDDLLDPRFTTITPVVAKKLIDGYGWAVVDVRPSNKEYKVPGAIEVPLFDIVDSFHGSRKKKARYVAQKMMGVAPTEMNPNFVSEVLEAAHGANVIVMCEKGGSLRTGKEKASRSLCAAWKLIVEDDTVRVAHLEGGTEAWTEFTDYASKTMEAAEGDDFIELLK